MYTLQYSNDKLFLWLESKSDNRSRKLSYHVHYFREITSDDVISPEDGRKVASEIGALYYYETSVLIPHGIDDVFENVIRVGLAYKRDKHFWSILNNSLKRVNRPHAQEPFMPPRPSCPQVMIPDSDWSSDMQKLYNDNTCCDLVFKTRHGRCLEAHRIVLIGALPSLEEFLCGKQDSCLSNVVDSKSIVRSSSSGSGWDVTSKLAQGRGHSLDTICLLSDDEVEEAASPCNEESERSNWPLGVLVLEHPVFCSVETKPIGMTPDRQVIVTLNDNISAAIFQHVLHFAYTWSLDDEVLSSCELLSEVKQIGEMLAFSILVKYVENIVLGDDYINDSLSRAARKAHQDRLKNLGMKRGICTGTDGFNLVHNLHL